MVLVTGVIASIRPTLFVLAVAFTAIHPVTAQQVGRLDLQAGTKPPRQVLAGRRISPPPVVQVKDSQERPLRDVLVQAALLTSGGVLAGDTARTNEVGEAVFSNLIIYDKPGPEQLIFVSGAKTLATEQFELIRGDPAKILIVRQPASQILSGAEFEVQPLARVLDNAENAITGVEVQVTLCKVPDDPLSSTVKCERDDSGLSALTGTTIAKSDADGQAAFTNLSLVGPSGRYRLAFEAVGFRWAQDTTAIMLYDPDRSSDRNYVVLSAIKSVAGRIPANEFFDARFRFRFHRIVFALASFDVALSHRDTDSLSSEQGHLTEAAALLNVVLYTRKRPITEERERTVFAGPSLRVFNTFPYAGGHVGSMELGGSAFHGSSFTIGIFHRLSEVAQLVDGDTLMPAKSNLFADFFIRSSTIDFFRALNLRGGILLPLRKNRKVESRIIVAVPVGTISLF
jgi:hypothetical protein